MPCQVLLVAQSPGNSIWGLGIPYLSSWGKSGVDGVTLDRYACNRVFILPTVPIGPCQVLLGDQLSEASLQETGHHC